jgi:hypothetical protein
MHPDRKNIDHHVNLPEGIAFREEAIWSQIKFQKQRKSAFYWWVAAAVVLISSIGLFLFSSSDDFQENILLTTASHQEIEIIPIPNMPKPMVDKTAETAVLRKESNIPQTEPQPSIQRVESVEYKEADRLIADKEETEEKIPEKIQTIEQKSAELLLSPAAQRLQASLDKVNPKSEIKEKIILQRMTLAEFLGANRNLDLAKGNNINQESVLSRFKFNGDENN